MKRLLLAAFTMLLIASCQFQPVMPQAAWDATAAAKTAMPPVTIQPSVAPPTATEALVPTTTPSPEPTACEPLIKGNIAADGTKIAHSPGQANYNNVVIDESKGERMFCTLEDAIAAGWRAAKN